ncbi:hypothetical protein [uncultured Bacteroides sp.]|nr:hypothetical protein [uncultured Bacteroides sp.]
MGRKVAVFGIVFCLAVLAYLIMPSQRHLTWRLWINRTISLFVNQLSANT